MLDVDDVFDRHLAHGTRDSDEAHLRMGVGRVDTSQEDVDLVLNAKQSFCQDVERHHLSLK